jgi:hypothetical protein
MDDTKLNEIVDAIVRELKSSGAVRPSASNAAAPVADARQGTPASTIPSFPSAVPVKPQFSNSPTSGLSIDLPLHPTRQETQRR